MDYFFYNTDARSLKGPPLPRFPILINRHFAALGGDPQRFGEQFRQLKGGDILLMYENRRGVIAIGRVSAPWDGKSHHEPWYYNSDEMDDLTGGSYEYRIPVEWFLDLSQAPVTLDRLREQFHSPGYTPRGAVKKITKYHSDIEALIADLTSQEPMTPRATDHAPANRAETTTYRILRDTAKAIHVKQVHEYECQLCGHTIVLPNGQRYAEAHHIKPLGQPHDGPDIVANIVCVCPNHHAELDYGVARLDLFAMRSADGHNIAPEFITYHNRVICSAWADGNGTS